MINDACLFLRKFLTVIVLFLIIFFNFSCASKKDVLYIQDIDLKRLPIENNYTTVFQPDDLIIINVTSADNKAVSPFNMPVVSTNINTGTVTGVQKQISYLIRKDGTIEFPSLGSVKLAGLSMLEAIEFLKSELKEYIKDPIVNIEWVNYKFTILGDVNRPGGYSVKNERTTILEAIGMAGDLNITGNRHEVYLIRELNNERVSIKLDLTSKEIFDSEAYFIKQNDVIIVQPNKAQINSSIYNRNAPLYISVASVIISLIAVLSRA